jgi:ATP-dependent Clp protease ATP-binding subunit ClpB
MLQILDDGRLTDSKGRTVDFRNTVIIMTSNVGSQYIHDFEHGTKTSAEEDVMRRNVEQELHRSFRPEFLNRLDDVIIFQALAFEDIKRIVSIQLDRLVALLGERRLSINLTDEAKEVLAREGFDTAFGARPLKRAIQKLVIDPLAIRILEGEFNPGETVYIDASPETGALVMSNEPTDVSVS